MIQLEQLEEYDLNLKTMKTKFWIKTRVFLSFWFFIIIITNIFATFLYIFVEKSFIANMKRNIEAEYNNVVEVIDNSENQVINFWEEEEQNLANKWLFLVVWLNDQDIKNNYRLWWFIYEQNYIFRWEHKGYDIVIWKNIRDLEWIKQYIVDTTLLLNIFWLFVAFIISYFVTNRVLKPLLKLSDFIRDYEINENKKFIINKYWSSEIWQITDSINSFISKVKENLESQKNFIQDTSHELKTPLMQIETNIELIEDKITDEKVIKKLENIKKSTANINKIISNLGFILRWDEKIIKKQKINVWDYIREFSKEFLEIAAPKNIKITIEEKNELIIENNTYYLDRLFWNLISNAIFYNNWDNEIKIIIDKNSIEIIDEWIWIHENEVNKIFSRFYRSQNSNLYDDQWNWLWMTIVKKICDKFGWQIDIKSELNKWTNIKITIT